MRKFVVPVVAGIGLTAAALAPAIAADMKVKAPIYTKAPPPVLTWTGCANHVGGNGGWKGSRFRLQIGFHASRYRLEPRRDPAGLTFQET